MNIKEIWLCHNCETSHETEYSAQNCCRAREAFQCQCKKVFGDEEEAKACCTKDASDAIQCLYCPTILTPEDLYESNLVGSLKLCGEHRPTLIIGRAA